MEEADTASEIIYVDKAMGRHEYPKWSFRRVKESMDKRKQEGGMKKKTKTKKKKTKKKQKDVSDRDTKTTVTIPYIKGVLEA